MLSEHFQPDNIHELFQLVQVTF